MLHLTIPPNVFGAILTLLFMTHSLAYIAGIARRDRSDPRSKRPRSRTGGRRPAPSINPTPNPTPPTGGGGVPTKKKRYRSGD